MMKLLCTRASRASGLLLDNSVYCTTPNTGKKDGPIHLMLFTCPSSLEIRNSIWKNGTSGYILGEHIKRLTCNTYYCQQSGSLLTRNDYVDSIIKLVHKDPITLQAMETLKNKCKEPFSAPLRGYRVLIIKTRHKQSLVKVSQSICAVRTDLFKKKSMYEREIHKKPQERWKEERDWARVGGERQWSARNNY